MKLLNEFFTIEKEEEAATGADYSVVLRDDHPICKAHFPGNPVTPGVCLLQMVEELTEKLTGRQLQLDVVHNVKFLSVIAPGKPPRLCFLLSTSDNSDGYLKVKATVCDEGGKTYSKISVTYKYE